MQTKTKKPGSDHSVAAQLAPARPFTEECPGNEPGKYRHKCWRHSGRHGGRRGLQAKSNQQNEWSAPKQSQDNAARPGPDAQTQWPDKEHRRQKERPLTETQRHDVPDPKILTKAQARNDEPA